MADRQTALAVFDFLDSLRAGQYRIGADAEKDHATAGLLASLSGDTGLRDAVCAKLISPGLERARFLMVAEHDPRALPLFASGQVKPWYQADYNVREIANSEFHQDKMVALWKKLAQRYRDEPHIAAYDIINEPNWGFADKADSNGCKENGNAPLKDLLVRTTRAIKGANTR